MKISTKNEKGFTLAETLITLTILGVVAAITVPSLINKQIESANRTKLKKAMAVYEKALNQMIIDQDAKGSLKTITGFDNTCSESTKYFKKVEQKSDCVFKTADRIWWDIEDIENPIIILKDKYVGTLYAHADSVTEAQKADNKEVFALLGHRDNSGVLRINDKGYEDGLGSTNNATNIGYMAKLYNFMNKETVSNQPTVSFSSLETKFKQIYNTHCSTLEEEKSCCYDDQCLDENGLKFVVSAGLCSSFNPNVNSCGVGGYIVPMPNGKVLVKYEDGSGNHVDYRVYENPDDVNLYSDYDYSNHLENCNEEGSACEYCKTMDSTNFCVDSGYVNCIDEGHDEYKCSK